MPKKIDHEERKETILSTALEVFAKEGYHDSNLSLIAEAAGISRPTVYQYFHNKDEIYYYAVKLITGRLFTKYSAIAWGDGESDEVERMKLILSDIVDIAIANEHALMNLMDVMVSAKRDGVDFADVIHHRTAKLSILFKRLLRQGIDNHRLRKLDIDATAEAIFNLAELVCFQVAFFKAFDKEGALGMISSYLESLKA
ncbi:MAG: TetR/AcrR family transcriptional regulator [Spirochaetes bacterium]|uniref:TetR/AcrR family transcriptional regulator n=1 Tax=Candidatus Ornithospirochaeta stercoripullorum TaxID=2840899 RepID=A0A9D9E391_9SPIO|nr:TetR/AcrR family transcriptional regulator [Candidatus Ornithospirochaeta stercoripullorum]